MNGRKYLDWVKTLPCSVCHTDQCIDPHHILGTHAGGKGYKSPDVWAIPLCRECHDGLHRDPKAFESENGFNQMFAALQTIQRAVFQGELTNTQPPPK